MKLAVRILVLAVIAVGVCMLLPLMRENQTLSEELQQLEAELGRMDVEDPSQVYVVAIENPKIPPEVADEVEKIWQFRCYLPPGYEYSEIQGAGWIGEGLYQAGSSSSSWSMVQKEARNVLCTITLKTNQERLQMHTAIAGASGSILLPADLGTDIEQMKVELLTHSHEGARSFSSKTILPLIKIYASDSAKKKLISGKELRIYRGATLVICPKQLESQYAELRQGLVPIDFDLSWVAEHAGEQGRAN